MGPRQYLFLAMANPYRGCWGMGETAIFVLGLKRARESRHLFHSQWKPFALMHVQRSLCVCLFVCFVFCACALSAVFVSV